MSRVGVVLVGAVFTGVVLASGCGSEPRVQPLPSADTVSRIVGLVTVVASDIRFEPTSLTAQPGQRLEIQLDNRDTGVLHNIRVDGPEGAIKVPLEVGPVIQQLTVRIDQAGEYTYLCEIHPLAMRGVLTVR